MNDLEKITFDPKAHKYTYDGTPVPNVTSLIKFICSDPYGNVPKKNLERAAKYGNKVHDIIERTALGEELGEVGGFEGIAHRRFLVLRDEWDIKTSSCEQKVVYIENGMPLYAGTYDMLGSVKGIPAVIDIKTTAEIHKDMLGVQLSLYKFAIEQAIETEIQKGYVLWLPKKDLGMLMEIDLIKPDVLLPKVENAYERYFSSEG